ncbi:MAG: aldehyde ferredoxin oxidoreductase N-terminal domain-containing protein, partial [Vicinamibacterales bacterium]|nr:aldehyde ferredoxin oxidoreductase N-terminal domain-containing protein [Vicinamibacterales bacterium]
MRNLNSGDGSNVDPAKVLYTRAMIDLAAESIAVEEVPCANFEDVLGGFGRSFQMLMARDVSDALAPDNPLIINTGILTGTNVMTGLRTYFSAFSPLKHSDSGLPAAIWSASSGKFGSKMKWTGLDEIVVEGQASRPLM